MTFRGFIVFLLALSLLSAVAAQEQSADALHVVITVEGETYVSRYSPPDHYSDGVVLTAGSFVRSNDILEVGPGSRVVILCANRATDEITNDFRSPNCPGTVAEPLVAFNNVEIYGQTRAAQDEGVYVVNPRHTMISSASPILEWTPARNASQRGITYRVTLYNMADNSIVWQKDGINGTRLEYPEDQQPLAAVDPAERPIRYQFVVTPIINNQELSTFDVMRPEGFCIVSARNRPLVERAVSELGDLTVTGGLPNEARSFNLAVYYHGRRLYGDALAQLMRILPAPLDQPLPAGTISAESIVGSPSYYILLGNILYAQRLPLNEVMPAYARAELIATTLNDTPALATINEQLGDILRGRKPQITPERDADIYARYQAAREFFSVLGDDAAVQRIDEKLQNAPQSQGSSFCQ